MYQAAQQPQRNRKCGKYRKSYSEKIEMSKTRLQKNTTTATSPVTHKMSLYYLVLVLLTLGMIGRTIFIGSAHVTYGHTIAQLQKKEQLLTERKRVLEQRKADQLSMTEISQQASAEGFQPMGHILRLNNTMVASR